MPRAEFDPEWIVDIVPRMLSGSIESESEPKWLKFQLSYNVSIDDDSRRVFIQANMDGRGLEVAPSDDEPDDSDDGELLYKGAVKVEVILEEEAEVVQDEQFAVDVLRAAWPHMRAILGDHGRRVGAPQTTLPMEFDAMGSSVN